MVYLSDLAWHWQKLLLKADLNLRVSQLVGQLAKRTRKLAICPIKKQVLHHEKGDDEALLQELQLYV